MANAAAMSRTPDTPDITPMNTQDQPSKLVIVALLATSLVLFTLGISAGVGLLNSYGKIQLISSWFTTATGWLANTTNHWGLWTLAIGGMLGGGVASSVGGYKIHKAVTAKVEENSIGSAEVTPPVQGQQHPVAIADAFKTDNFAKLGLDDNLRQDMNFLELQAGQFTTVATNRQRSQWFLVRKSGTTLEFTTLLNEEQTDQLIVELEAANYKYVMFFNREARKSLKDFTAYNYLATRNSYGETEIEVGEYRVIDKSKDKTLIWNHQAHYVVIQDGRGLRTLLCSKENVPSWTECLDNLGFQPMKLPSEEIA